MPRLPVDGKKVIEYRHTFGTKEREILQDLATSFRIQAVDPEAMLKILEDPLRVVQIAYGIATVLELIGFETGLPTPGDLPELYQWLTQKKEINESGETFSIVEMLKKLWSSETGGYPGGY